MLLRPLSAAALGVALTLQIAMPSEAATLISEDFNSVSSLFVVSTSIPSFTVTSGNVDVIGSGTGFDPYTGNGSYIDLNGSDPGSITSSVFTFSTGDIVTLSFDYGTNSNQGPNSADVSLGSLFSTILLSSSTSPSVFTPFSTTFTVGSGTTASLLFASLTSQASGIIIDNVSLTTVNNDPIVPEPAMFPALLAFSAIGGVLVLRRKQASEQA